MTKAMLAAVVTALAAFLIVTAWARVATAGPWPGLQQLPPTAPAE